MELTLTDFALFILTAAFVLVTVCTVVSRSFHARSETRSLARRVICRLCLHAFEHAGRGVVHCPHCGAANEKKRHARAGW
jgi:hypothetical protein